MAWHNTYPEYTSAENIGQIHAIFNNMPKEYNDADQDLLKIAERKIVHARHCFEQIKLHFGSTEWQEKHEKFKKTLF